MSSLRYSQFAPILEEKLEEVRKTDLREQLLTVSQKVRINRFLGEIPELKQTLERLIDSHLDSGSSPEKLEHLLDLHQQLESIQTIRNIEINEAPPTPIHHTVITTTTTTSTSVTAPRQTLDTSNAIYRPYPASPAEQQVTLSESSSPSSSDADELNDYVLLEVGRVPPQQEVGDTPIEPTGEHECPICGMDAPANDCLMLQCSHVYCKTCIVSYLKCLMEDGKLHNVVCPDPTCKATISDIRAQRVLPEKEFQKFSRLRLLSTYQREPNCRWCPRPDCETPIVGDPNNINFPKLSCITCDMDFCFHCVKPWHDGKCAKTKSSRDRAEEEAVKKLRKKLDWAECPSCKVIIERTSGCLLITCFCGCMFCYKCNSVAINQYTATCSCQPGHRFLSLEELGRDRPYGADVPSRPAVPSYYETLDQVLVRELEESDMSDSKANKGWKGFTKRVKLGLLNLKNGLVGIVVFSKK